MSGAFEAAIAVASAKAMPARGAWGGAAVRRQVMHTMMVALPVGSISLIPVAPIERTRGAEPARIGCCRFPHSRDELDRRRGTPPGTRPKGWQVSWLAGQCSLPPSRPVDRTDQWHRASARRLQLRGQPWICIGALPRSIRTTFLLHSLTLRMPPKVGGTPL